MIHLHHARGSRSFRVLWLLEELGLDYALTGDFDLVVLHTSVPSFKSDVKTIEALKAANPQPNTELEYTTVFELLAAVLLSAQATDVGVNKATRILFPLARTPQQMLDLGLERLEPIDDHSADRPYRNAEEEKAVGAAIMGRMPSTPITKISQ